MKISRSLAGFVVSALMGCASAPSLIPVTDSSQRLEFKGFSVQPPAGRNWFLAARSGADVPVAALAKRLEDAESQRARRHSIVAMARLIDAGDRRFANAAELRTYVEHTIKEDSTRDPRFRLRELTTATDSSLAALCMKYDMIKEDRGVPGQVGVVFIMDAHSIQCVHPQSPRHIVEIGYSERRREGDASMNVEPEVRPFLRSLQFMPLP